MSTYSAEPPELDSSAPPIAEGVEATDDVAAVQRTWITEDWLATIVGLSLLLLLLTGILPKDLF